MKQGVGHRHVLHGLALVELEDSRQKPDRTAGPGFCEDTNGKSKIDIGAGNRIGSPNDISGLFVSLFVEKPARQLTTGLPERGVVFQFNFFTL